ncbi:hypothetical protein D3C85_954280 [compost metagenome]
MPPSAMPSTSRRSMRSLLMKRRLDTGIRKAQAPIMIGKAAVGFMPIRLSMMSEGA